VSLSLFLIIATVLALAIAIGLLVWFFVAISSGKASAWPESENHRPTLDERNWQARDALELRRVRES